MPDNSQLDERAVARVSGPAWEPIRGAFLELANKLLATSKDARSELTTIYVKFCTSSTMKAVYAVVWLKNSKELVVGLALPDDVSSPLLCQAPPKAKYRGLTKYLVLRPGDSVPVEFEEWTRRAFAEAQREDG